MGNKSPLAFCNVHGVAQKIKELVLAGSPRSVEKVLAAARTFFINQILVRGGAGDLLPCWSLVITTQGLMATFIEGIADTAQSLSSIAYGEKDYRNIRLTIKKTFFYGAFVTILMAALLAVFRSQIVTLFGQTDPVLAAISATGLLFIAVSLVFNLASNIIVNFFTATSRSWIATTISVCRIFIFSVVPAWFLFPHYSINAVFGSFLLLEVGGLLVLGASLLLVRARSPNLSPFLLLDRQEEQRIKAIDFSVLNDTEEITDAAAKIGEFCREHDIPSKERFHVSLAIEEMLLMIKEHAFKPGIKEYCDVRIAIYSGVLIMRIRDIGKHFNPVEYYYNNKDSADGFMETIGVDMILKMAMNVEYRETYGVNNLIITI
jgi:anti-sigma regulatory factor (Ser/Thr protein kinase)